MYFIGFLRKVCRMSLKCESEGIFHFGVLVLSCVQVHLLLVWTIIACAASVLIESFRPDVLELKRVRAFCTTLQGAWFYTVAFLLYNPYPDANHPWVPAEKHAATMWVGVIFGWLCFAVAVVHLAICAHVSGCSPPKRQALVRMYLLSKIESSI